MKITETIERECCHPQHDLKLYQGIAIKGERNPKFCVHCGQIWIWTRRAGEMDGGYEKVTISVVYPI